MQKQRGYRMCDQCGRQENPAVQKFRLCGGCLTTQYCSPDCQKSHWPAHKVVCQHTTQQLANVQQSSAMHQDDNLAKSIRKFTSAHNSLLTWAGYQALNLKRCPAAARQNALLIELSHRGSHADSSRRFSVASTHIVPRDYVRDRVVMGEILGRDERCRQQGGFGCIVVIIQCGGVSQVMPVEVDHPSTIGWDSREDWQSVLHHFVDSGRTDFKPISTSSKGVYYG